MAKSKASPPTSDIWFLSNSNEVSALSYVYIYLEIATAPRSPILFLLKFSDLIWFRPDKNSQSLMIWSSFKPSFTAYILDVFNILQAFTADSK